MNLSKHLKEANKNYGLDYESIAPISENDAIIISSLKEIFHLIEYYELEDILNNYKKNTDAITIDLLNNFIKNGAYANKTLVLVKDKLINVHFLQSISLRDEYSTQKRAMIYKLIINEDDTERVLFANTEVVFESEKLRIKTLNDLKEKLKYFKVKFI
jgi:hypothetical protein